MEIPHFRHTLIDRYTWPAALPRLLRLLGAASFVALDTEFTGLGDPALVRARCVVLLLLHVCPQTSYANAADQLHACGQSTDE